MAELVTHLPVTLKPNSVRTVLRPFALEDPVDFAATGHPRTLRIAERVLALDDAEVQARLHAIMDTLDARHRNAATVLDRRFDELALPGLDRNTIGDARALAIGAYLTEEFSFESAALFNPSIVAHPDQSGIAPEATRFILSLRGIGEGHVSSLTFRSGIWEADGSIVVDEPSRFAVPPRIEPEATMEGGQVVHIDCGGSREISETVIFPFLPSQGKGIEDVRLVAFTEDDGTVDWRGTFTAFDGSDVRQTLLRTGDFRRFEMRAVEGVLAGAKGAALFPRRIDGRHMILGRHDSENIWLFASDDAYRWDDGAKIVTPRYEWEAVQIGNCGSPIELDEGWLLLTHGVGMVRNYCVGACLLDKRDPSKLLARLPHPLLEPSDTERDGYVPNVVYSCGALLRGRTLLLPYGVADTYSAFATVGVDKLLAAMA